MNTAILPVLFAVTIALAACQQSADTSAQADAPDESANEGVAPASPTASASTGTAGTEASGKEINLTAEGVIVVNAIDGRGTATTLTFGMPQKNVLDAMQVDFGEPDMSGNGECGAGPMQFAKFGALQLNFLEGKFAGWFAEDGDNLVTIDGIRPGATLEGLRGERQVTMAESTLDGEFSYASADGGTIGGFAGADEKVASLFAGTNCFFR